MITWTFKRKSEMNFNCPLKIEKEEEKIRGLRRLQSFFFLLFSSLSLVCPFQQNDSNDVTMYFFRQYETSASSREKQEEWEDNLRGNFLENFHKVIMLMEDAINVIEFIHSFLLKINFVLSIIEFSQFKLKKVK